MKKRENRPSREKKKGRREIKSEEKQAASKVSLANCLDLVLAIPSASSPRLVLLQGFITFSSSSSPSLASPSLCFRSSRSLSPRPLSLLRSHLFIL